jgi:hypothetical protein
LAGSNGVGGCSLAQLGMVKVMGSGAAPASAFTLTATGDASTGLTVISGTTPVAAADAPLGVYTLTETGPAGYTPGFSCSGGTLVGNKLTITGADAGNTITCTVTNTYAPGSSTMLGLLKTVSGLASPTDFILTATGDPSTGPMVVTGTTPVAAVNVPVGIYTLTETGPTGYAAGFSCSGGGTLVGNKLTITAADAGHTITCTIANTMSAGSTAMLGLVKTVSGGLASITDFILTATGAPATGPTVVTGTTPVTAVTVPLGVYTLTESGPANYTAVFSCLGNSNPLVGNTLTIGLADAGNTITCTIANTFAAGSTATLNLFKTVNGGAAASTDFFLTATGPIVVTGTTPVLGVTVPLGVYTLTETGPAGYTSAISCTGGTLVGNTLTIGPADAGLNIACTFDNTSSTAKPIPTLNEWGAIFFMILAGLGSVYYLKKYRKA